LKNDSKNYIQKSISSSPKNEEIKEIFFSLMDYRNNYFLSNDPMKIIHFYQGFTSRDELVEWMKERPKGSCLIMEAKGEKDIIVVIPTADIEGEYAKRCRQEIFKGLHIIFVVSGKDNNYFNYSHNCNVGLKKAMEYNPKWVVVSNDDLYEIDKNDILRTSPLQINHKTIDTVFVTPTDYHAYDAELSKSTIFRTILFIVLGKLRIYQLRLEKKYNVKYFLSPRRLSHIPFYRGIIRA